MVKVYNVVIAIVFVAVALQCTDFAIREYNYGITETAMVHQELLLWSQNDTNVDRSFSYAGPTGWPFNFYYPCPSQNSLDCGSFYNPTFKISSWSSLAFLSSVIVLFQFAMRQTLEVVEHLLNMLEHLFLKDLTH